MNLTPKERNQPEWQDGGSARVLEEVSEERARQDQKWGEQNHPNGTGDDRRLLGVIDLPTWGTICYNARQRADRLNATGRATYLDILLEEVAEALSESDPDRLRAELIQIAAVAVQWVEAIDRRRVTEHDTNEVQ